MKVKIDFSNYLDRDVNDDDDETGVEIEIEVEKGFAENPLRGAACLDFASALNADQICCSCHI